ncbi:hypothetical protein F4813DRAFT_376289 [Daldinia decipiens]|uniref:uncharacterized protein n=1 Tax=Daldinia decipiens TaxID=326647 RepID=UPI0020C44DAF|nr:uncharacterized protein F4813DRAFT_376289 [Daldinia decipiens]KAI1653009.1 hypothetical protein F4813DRAFT_376289 [Daldinia decipiens]
MLRQLYTRARPSLIRPVVHHRQFRSRPQLSFPNYAPPPPPPGPYFSPPPRSRGSRLKDIALGSVFTIVAYIAYHVYSFRQFSKHVEGAVEKFRQQDAMDDELHLSLADARRAGDHDRLREIVFQHARRISDGWTEFGPLPSFPGTKNIIPEEDTLMFILYGNDDVAASFYPNGVLGIRIVINAELNEEFIPSKNPKEGAALTELLARTNYLIADLVRKGMLDEGTELVLHVFLRGQTLEMYYNINLPTPEDETENAA